MSDWGRDSGRDGLDKELAAPCPTCGHALYKHREPGGKCDACVCVRKREPKYGCHDCAFLTESASRAVEHGALDGHQVFYLRNVDGLMKSISDARREGQRDGMQLLDSVAGPAVERAIAEARAERRESELGWLVELNGDPRPCWWTGHSPTSFTFEALEAMRFARARDAQLAIAWLVEPGTRRGCKAVEHGFGVGGGEANALTSIYEGQAEALREQDAEIARLRAKVESLEGKG